MHVQFNWVFLKTKQMLIIFNSKLQPFDKHFYEVSLNLKKVLLPNDKTVIACILEKYRIFSRFFMFSKRILTPTILFFLVSYSHPTHSFSCLRPYIKLLITLIHILYYYYTMGGGSWCTQRLMKLQEQRA